MAKPKMSKPHEKQRPEQWSLEKAKQEQAKVTEFDQSPPKFRIPQRRSK